MPGYGFSGKPTTTGWNPARIASAFHELMLRLGYPRYVSQGGDWGAIISELLAVQAPEGLLGIHVNMPGTVPPDMLRHLGNFDAAPRSCRIARRSPTTDCCTSTVTASVTRR